MSDSCFAADSTEASLSHDKTRGYRRPNPAQTTHQGLGRHDEGWILVAPCPPFGTQEGSRCAHPVIQGVQP